MNPRTLLVGIGAAMLLAFIALGVGRPSLASADGSGTSSWDVAVCIQQTTLGNDPDNGGAAVKICTSENNGSVSNPTFADNNGDTTLNAGDNGEEASSFYEQSTPPASGAVTEPYFDGSDSTWEKAGLVAAPGGSVTDGDQIGSIRFWLTTNALFLGSNNIDPSTGQPPQCNINAGTHFGATFKLYDGDLGTSSDIGHAGSGAPGRVDYRDAFPVNGARDTLQDLYGPTGAVAPDGLFDGVDLLPSAFDNLWASTGLGPVVLSRALGRAVVVASLGVDVDSNFTVYDLSGLAGGPPLFMSQQTINYPWMPYGDLHGQNITSLTVISCPPFIASPVRVFGKTVGNFTRCDATTCGAVGPAPAIPGGAPWRTIGGASPSFINYTLYPTSDEDYDGDTIALVNEKCRYDPTSAADTNNNGVVGRCDSTGEAAQSYPSPLCKDPADGTTSGTALQAQSFQPFAQNQDLDCDGVPNRVDNCPLNFNPLQGDTDVDGVGDACDPPGPPGPAIGIAASIIGNSSGYFCNGAVTGGALPNVACDASTNGVRDADNQCVDQIQIPSTPGEPAGEAASAPGTSPAGTQPYKYCMAGRSPGPTTNADQLFANPAMMPTSNAVLNTLILPNLYRDSNDNRVPDFFDQFFTGLPENTLSSILYDVKDSDGDGYSDACEALLAREGDALNPNIHPGPPSLPGDCDGDGVSDAAEAAGGGDGNPFVNTAWVQTGEGGVAGNCADNIDNDGDGFKDKADRQCVPTGKWDADGDCRLDTTETGLGMNMYNTFDFPNVPTPSLNVSATGTFDSAISGQDLSALLAWGGASDNAGVNPNGADYDSDNNNDHRDDGRDYDFGSPAPGALGWSQDGTIGGSDLSKLLGVSATAKACG